MDNTSVTRLSFQFELERDPLQDLFSNKDDENETEQERGGSRVSQTVEEWCKCDKCETMLKEKECWCCHKAAWHDLNGNIWGGSRIFMLSKLEIFATNNSQLPDASNCHKMHHVRCKGFWVSIFEKSYIEVWFDLIWCLFKVDIYIFALKASLTKVAHLIKTNPVT